MGTRRIAAPLEFASVDGLLHVHQLPFYERLDSVLVKAGFDEFVEEACRDCYPVGVGRRSMPPAVYFRVLLLAFLLGIESERGIALQVGDSLSVRKFLGYALTSPTPSRSALARARRRIPFSIQQKVFAWVLERLAETDTVLRLPALARGSAARAARAAGVPAGRARAGRYATFVKDLASCGPACGNAS
ncbi:MAG: transposase [Bryobacterales bacterium]|nr:transposase [Bryobacterales bacterium]